MCIHVWFLLKAVFTPADAIVLSIPGLLVEQLGMSVSVRLTPAAATFYYCCRYYVDYQSSQSVSIF